MGKQAKANKARGDLHRLALVCECGHPLSAHMHGSKGEDVGYCAQCADMTVLVHRAGLPPEPAILGCTAWRPVRGTVKAVRKLERTSGPASASFNQPFRALLRK